MLHEADEYELIAASPIALPVRVLAMSNSRFFNAEDLFLMVYF